MKQLNIEDRVLAFFQRTLDDPFHRYRSWEHCYQFFAQNPTNMDHVCLHLGMYLASWGMYRGSSFLLQKDYRVHGPVVEELLRPEYQVLKAISLADLQSEEGTRRIAMIVKLVRRIKDCYIDLLSRAQPTINVTDTLATKILLGTLGCTPAYDTYFVSGLKSSGLSFSYLNSRNFSQMVNYCQKYQDSFRKAQKRISVHRGLHYPDIKVIDMYFWMLGFEKDGRSA